VLRGEFAYMPVALVEVGIDVESRILVARDHQSGPQQRDLLVLCAAKEIPGIGLVHVAPIQV
jgi:hypothetical protein